MVARKSYRAAKVLAALFLLPPLLLGCGSVSDTSPVSRTAFYFDTVIQISIYGEPEDKAEAWLDECIKTASFYDSSLRPGIRPDEADTEAAALFDTALYWRDITGGAFSPTLGTLTSLWNFNGDPPGPVPPADEIKKALAATAPDSPDMLIDLGGIAKGYIADRLKDELVSNGARSAVINLGGNVLLIGSKPDGTPFHVGIQDPDSDTGAGVIATVEAADKSVVTSGVYERYFTENGVSYHHILDPATGYPADSGLKAVSVISSDSTAGDALSTACLVLGQEKGQALIESLPDTEALFVLDSGELIRTAGFPDIR